MDRALEKMWEAVAVFVPLRAEVPTKAAWREAIAEIVAADRAEIRTLRNAGVVLDENNATLTAALTTIRAQCGWPHLKQFCDICDDALATKEKADL